MDFTCLEYAGDSTLYIVCFQGSDQVGFTCLEYAGDSTLYIVCFQGSGQVDFTCLEYAGDSTLYIATNSGKVSAWDTRHNSCFMHWEADTQEIGERAGIHDGLVTSY